MIEFKSLYGFYRKEIKRLKNELKLLKNKERNKVLNP